MNTVYLITIESIEQRYTSQWKKWIPAFFKKNKYKYVEVNGGFFNTNFTKKTINGEFLDICKTNEYKSMQLLTLISYLETGKIHDTDVILYLDAWNPTIFQVKYMLDLKNLKTKIYGIFHAGTYDEWDFLAQKGCEKWGKYVEEGIMKICDKIFVATSFHKQLIVNKGRCPKSKIVATGLPFGGFCLDPYYKENTIVFPHRLAPEKKVESFDNLEKEWKKRYPNSDLLFIKSMQVTSTKQEYYDLLRRAKYVYSDALQETWGIAILEGVYSGCYPIVPNKLSYKELYPDCFKFNIDDKDNGISIIEDIEDSEMLALQELLNLQYELRNKFDVDNVMANIMIEMNMGRFIK